MSLWGAYTTDESKPKYLTEEEKKNCYATDAGWVYKHPNGDEEVLVAIGKLAGTSTTTGLGAADINSVEFVTTSMTADGGNFDIRVIYNEKVTVTTTGGTPTITIDNDQAGGGSAATFDAAYQSGSGTNKIVFRVAIPGAGEVAEDDVLSIAAQNIALNSGTMKDTASASVNAKVAISAAQATACGEITVAAGA